MTSGSTSTGGAAHVRNLESLQATDRFGHMLANALAAGDVVALIGELGAGKTRLVQATTQGLGVTDDLVHSPTFVLIQEYSGRLPVFHIDAYRLRDADEFLELGADELFASEGVCLIEWADRVREVLPRDHLRIELAATGPESRQVQMTAFGPRSRELLENVSRES